MSIVPAREPELSGLFVPFVTPEALIFIVTR